MKRYRLVILALAVFVSVATYGQLFQPLGLGMEKCERKGNFFKPQMHVEGDILYVCTNQGLYSKDLSDDESTWQLVGFENIPLQDYVRKGDDMLALRHNEKDNFLLLSHDGGKSWNAPQTEPVEKSNVYDFEQYGGKLLFYTESDVYEISKAELLAQASSVRNITTTIPDASPDIYDLQGRRLSAKPQKGVYIQNGKKKVVVKVTP